MASISRFYERRNSHKMSTKPQPTDVLAYRDDTGQVRYAAAPSNPHQPLAPSTYDSDGEPLISTSSRHNVPALDDDAMQRFTATGRPMAPFEQSVLQSWGGDMYTVPQFLPKQYTDDSIIPAILTNVLPSPANPAGTKAADGEDAAAAAAGGGLEVPSGGSGGGSGSGKRRKSFAKIFGSSKSGESKGKDGKGVTKVVFMPRREYIKYFAKDNDGNYCGTEPYRQWTEGELDEKFGEYKPKHDGKRPMGPSGAGWWG